ncbi:2-oxoacid:ferredoxin oxidoreductase subunit beta, partial [Nocardioides sp. LHD-245]|nr:2-oxoacid:ferredoxin oxidoreductase subunit beta [Nocardioides sp. LHD-245]
DRKHLTAVLAAAAAHRGTSLVEIYQNCPIFNDGAFDAIKGMGEHKGEKEHAVIPLTHGQPITFGALDEATGLGDKALVRAASGGVDVADTATVPADAILVHDAHNADPSTAFAISRLTDAGYLNRSPIGIFRQIDRPTYDDQARAQVATATEAVAGRGTPEERLAALINAGDTWTVD